MSLAFAIAPVLDVEAHLDAVFTDGGGGGGRDDAERGAWAQALAALTGDDRHRESSAGLGGGGVGRG